MHKPSLLGVFQDIYSSLSLQEMLILFSSLTPDDIPHKLRCANCSKLAVNAFRLPCCEQAICDSCMHSSTGKIYISFKMLILLAGHSSLPPSCPVCEHSPLSADDCTPNKSLRTTIKVFLRTAEKKREASKPKEPQESVPEVTAESQNGTQTTLPLSGEDGASNAQLQTNGSSQVQKDQEKNSQDVTHRAHDDDANKVCI